MIITTENYRLSINCYKNIYSLIRWLSLHQSIYGTVVAMIVWSLDLLPMESVPITITTDVVSLDLIRTIMWESLSVTKSLATSLWFSLGPTISSTNKTDRHDITEILLKVVLDTINQTNQRIYYDFPTLTNYF